MMSSNGNVSVSEKTIQLTDHVSTQAEGGKLCHLLHLREMLLKAQQGGYAVGAFNAENMEMVKAIIQAAEELKAPVMIQTTPSTIKYGTLETYQLQSLQQKLQRLPFRYACTWIMAAALTLR